MGQHLLLKAVSQAVVVPFLSTSLIETVQSDIASEKPGIFDFLKEGLLRLGPQSGSRTLPMWQLIPPSVIHSMLHYIISTIVRAVSGKIMKSRHRALQEQQGAISKPKGAPPGLSQYREQVILISKGRVGLYRTKLFSRVNTSFLLRRKVSARCGHIFPSLSSNLSARVKKCVHTTEDFGSIQPDPAFVI